MLAHVLQQNPLKLHRSPIFFSFLSFSFTLRHDALKPGTVHGRPLEFAHTVIT